MSAESTSTPPRREPQLREQTVVVIGGSAGIGLETARLARSEGANVILTARNRQHLERAAREVDASNTAAFDADDWDALKSFFDGLPTTIDHVMLTGPGPIYAPPLETEPEEARRALSDHLLLTIQVARSAAGKVTPGGSLVFMGGTGARRPRAGLGIANSATVATQALIASLALDLAPIRVNLIAAGFVDTPLSASILGEDLEKRRDQLRARLPIGRVVGPEDVAALAVHIMSNTALTGATYDIDGGQQLVE
jgi:NAD(P)-dependent dehydrogenase (short-subunit alcohol dehydrogenase family)